MLFELVYFWVSVYSQFQLMDENNFLFIVLMSVSIASFDVLHHVGFWGRLCRITEAGEGASRPSSVWPCKGLCLLNRIIISSAKSQLRGFCCFHSALPNSLSQSLIEPFFGTHLQFSTCYFCLVHLIISSVLYQTIFLHCQNSHLTFIIDLYLHTISYLH